MHNTDQFKIYILKKSWFNMHNYIFTKYIIKTICDKVNKCKTDNWYNNDKNCKTLESFLKKLN